MKNEEKEMYVKHKAQVAEQVLVWLILDLAKFRYHNSVNYLSRLKNIRENTVVDGVHLGNRALAEFSTLFHFEEKMLTFICGSSPRIDGKRVRLTKEILSKVKSNSDLLHYVGKKNVTYKSGKKFSHVSYWIINPKVVEKLFTDKAYSNPSSSKYSEEAKALINGLAFHYAQMKVKTISEILKNMKKIKEDENMTKAEKEKLKAECEQGLHCMSFEDLVKHIEKKEKTKIKRLQTRIRKLTQKAMIEINLENEKLKLENAELKSEVDYLKQLKDLNSDIPDDEVKLIKKSDKPHENDENTDVEIQDIINETPETLNMPNLITDEWLQKLVDQHKISDVLASQLSSLVLGHKTQFNNNPQGWNDDDYLNTIRYRQIIGNHILHNLDAYKIDKNDIPNLRKVLF